MIESTDCVGLRPSARAEALRRSQWRSRSGVTPSNARAPSKTEEPSQKACVRGPATRTLPSCQSPSSHVQVSDHFAICLTFAAANPLPLSHGAESTPTPEARARGGRFQLRREQWPSLPASTKLSAAAATVANSLLRRSQKSAN